MTEGDYQYHVKAGSSNNFAEMEICELCFIPLCFQESVYTYKVQVTFPLGNF